MAAEFSKRAAAAVLFIALTTLTGCGSPDTAGAATTPVAAASSAQPGPASSPDAVASEKTDLARAVAARASASAEAAARKNAAAEAAVAAPVLPASAAPGPVPATNFIGWVNSTLATYGVSPGPAASFVVGDTSFCGGYMCTTTYRNGTAVIKSLTTVSPGAIGNNFALIHEVAHQHGVGFRDTGGECAADVWARQYIQGSIYC